MRLWWVMTGLVGCAQPAVEVCDEPSPTPAQGLSWHADARDLVEQRCARCHVDGGPAPFALTTLDEVRNHSAAISASVADHEMPPWKAASCCGAYQHDWGLSPEARATLLGWIDQGMVEGDAADYAPSPPINTRLARVDRTVGMARAFTPPGEADTTRCFLLDWPVQRATNVTGYEVRPGDPTIVHHAIVLTAGPSVVRQFAGLDELSAGDGWACPGGVVVGYTGWLGGWSPGWGTVTFPTGVGQPIEPGSKIILTVHYSVPTPDPGPDLTTIDLMTEEEVAANLGSVPVFNPAWLFNLRIPAGQQVEESYAMRPVSLHAGDELLAVNLHMHERGVSGGVAVAHADGTQDCLVQVDDYDYEYQNDYWLQTPKTWRRGDKLVITCRWDNTEGHQRVVDGEPETPRDQHWADDGEMCVGFVTFQTAKR